jgi:hypothetical protein
VKIYYVKFQILYLPEQINSNADLMFILTSQKQWQVRASAWTTPFEMDVYVVWGLNLEWVEGQNYCLQRYNTV